MLILNCPNQPTVPHQENRIRRRRYQKGSLQARWHGKRLVWVVLYWDSEGHHGDHTIGPKSDFTKSGAQVEQAKFMESINGGQGEDNEVRPFLVREFVTQVYLPFYRGKWKGSTRGTSENRIQYHVVGDLGTGNWRV